MNQKHKTSSLFLALIGLAVITFSCTQSPEETAFPEEVIEQLEDLYDEDQMMRNTETYLNKWALELYRKHGRDGHDYQLVQARHDSLAKERALIDIKNAEVLSKIIDEYGWPDRSKTSRLANHTSFLVVQHNFEIQEKYLPLLLESAQRGESSSWNVAWLQDRILLAKGLPQRYGSQLFTINGTTYLWPLEDSVNVDALRAKMGLKTLIEYLGGEMYPMLPDSMMVTIQFY